MAQQLLVDDTALGPMAALLDGRRVVRVVLPFTPNFPELGSIHTGWVRKSISGSRDCLVELASKAMVHLSARRGAGAKHIQDGVQVWVQIVREAEPGKLAEASTKKRIHGRYSMLVSSFRGLQGADGKASTRPIMLPRDYGLRLTPSASAVPDGVIAAEAARLEDAPLTPVEAAVAALPAQFTGRIVLSSRSLWAQRADLWRARYPDLAECLVFESAPDGALFDEAGVASWLRCVEEGHMALEGASSGDVRFGTLHGINVLDVNAGKALKPGGARAVNLAAIKTLAGLLPAAQIGGLCLVDFIDMDGKGDRHAVHRALDAALAADRLISARTDLSQFGCVELRRRKTGPCLQSKLRREPILDGLALLQAAMAAAPPSAHGTLHIRAPRAMAAWLEQRQIAERLQRRMQRPIVLKADENLAPGSHHIALQAAGG